MTNAPTDGVRRRVVNCVLSARSLPYSRACLGSLLRNCAEPIVLRLITDSASDAEKLSAAFDPVAREFGQVVEIFDKAATDARAQDAYRGYLALLEFRNGHPCWRKVTDPELFTDDGDEVIIIDPDVFFPNPFTFEHTPASGLMLMWQAPNCLLPEPLVQEVFDTGIGLADHTDIGVCQYRSPLPLEFLEQFLRKIPTSGFTSSMHVESIVWAALAMQMGGGYLDAHAWHCYQNTVMRRFERKLGRDPLALLRRIDFSEIKAFHAGGVAKDWLPDAERAGILGDASPNRKAMAACSIERFEPYRQAKFQNKVKSRALARKVGIYKLLAQ